MSSERAVGEQEGRARRLEEEKVSNQQSKEEQLKKLSLELQDKVPHLSLLSPISSP
jgi:hypothetical protein